MRFRILPVVLLVSLATLICVSGGQAAKKPKAKSLVKAPAMPLKPLKKGTLSGLVVVIDPGHGGADPGCHWTEVFKWKGKSKTVTFYEAGYTYRVAWELAWKLRANGATVYLTTYSQVMKSKTSPQQPLPLPRDARYTTTGKGVIARSVGLKPRTSLAASVWGKWRKSRKIAFISIHVDSMPEGWQGAHVCVDARSTSEPKLAGSIASQLERRHMERRHNGKRFEAVDERRLYIINGSKNPIPERVLIELATPRNDNDSWRLRNPDSRSQLSSAIFTGLENLTAKRKTHSSSKRANGRHPKRK